jgi:hypothetical protein
MLAALHRLLVGVKIGASSLESTLVVVMYRYTYVYGYVCMYVCIINLQKFIRFT